MEAPPSQAEAEAAIRTLLRWAGEDPQREGLLDTPARVAKAYRDWFSGYAMDPADYLRRTFEEVEGYDELIVGSSRVDLQACKLEYSIVSPK